MYNCLNQVKIFYDQGFKCIKYEQKSDDELVIYMKNFENEKIQTMYCNDKQEIQEIREYIDLN